MIKSAATPITEDNQPTISVVLCNYNYGHFIGQAIKSVLNQTYRDFELIIVDDGSTDDSRSIIQSNTDYRIVRIFKENGGQASALNEGISAARADFVSFLDSDDLWKPNKLQEVISAFSRGNFSIVQHKLDVIDTLGKSLGRSHPGGLRTGIRDVEIAYIEENRTGFFSSTSGITCRRRALSELMPLDESWEICADIPLTRPLALYGLVCTLSESLGFYRVHGANHWMNTKAQDMQIANEFRSAQFTNAWLKKFGSEKLIDIEESQLYQDSGYSYFSELGVLERYPFKNSNSLLVDVGANVGTFSKRFLDCGWQILAFEPELDNYAAITKDIGDNPRVTLVAKAVSNVSGQQVPFYVSEEHFGIHSLKPFHSTHHYGYDIETIRLDDALNTLDIETVTLLKIDIEGPDFLALQSFDFSKYHPEVIIVEFMDERTKAGYGYTHHDVVRFMQEFGYVSFVSEWAPIVEYARFNQLTDSHVWLGCDLYPLNHEPAWGNLIIIPQSDTNKFNETLSNYMLELKTRAVYSKSLLGILSIRAKKVISNITVAKRMYYRYRNIKQKAL